MDDAPRRNRADEIDRYQEMYLAGGMEGVALVAADTNACPACAALADQMYLPSRLPPLPIAGCTAASGCRCRYEPSVTVYE
jgi:hypothetical protein